MKLTPVKETGSAVNLGAKQCSVMRMGLLSKTFSLTATVRTKRGTPQLLSSFILSNFSVQSHPAEQHFRNFTPKISAFQFYEKMALDAFCL